MLFLIIGNIYWKKLKKQNIRHHFEITNTTKEKLNIILEAALEMGPVIGLPNPGGVPRPAVSHMQPVDPGVLLAGAWEGAGKQDTLVQRRTGRETGP